ncbi:uncharacterized protein METZ01_LOCUS348161, partial [marine metagenome]
PQRPLRPLLPAGCTRAGRPTSPRQQVRRHMCPGTPPRARRGPRLQTRNPGWVSAPRPLPQPPCPRRRPRHRRTAAPPTRACGDARGHRPRRPPGPADDGRPFRSRKAAPHRDPPPPARDLHLPRPSWRGPLCRQGHQPAVPCPQLLLDRRAPQGPAPPPRDRTHRPPGVLESARGSGHRDPAHPPAPAPLQPPGDRQRTLRLPQAHARRSLSPTGRRPRGQRRRRPLRRTGPIHLVRPTGDRGSPLGRPAAALHGACPRGWQQLTLYGSPVGGRRMPLFRSGRRVGLCRHRGPRTPGPHLRARTAARTPRRSDETAGGRRTL